MLVNTQEFRREALAFLDRGYYVSAPPGSLEFYEYWTEQLRRCKEGYEVGGVRITGHHYFYLNFVQIKLTESVKGKAAQKTRTFPHFWDGDYKFFHKMEEAREKGKHLIVAKARRKGFSYKLSAIAANTYNSVRESYVLMCAYDKKYLYPKGIMTMATDCLNFLNENTGWSKRRSVVDKQNHKKASFYESINGVSVERGYKSEIEALTFKDNPDAARGKDASLVIFEECYGFGTRIRMADGSLKEVQDIVVGDYTMGVDGQPKLVESTNQGTGDLYKVSQKRGIDYIVNGDHLLVLHQKTNAKGVKDDGIKTISVKDYLALPKYKRDLSYGFKQGVDPLCNKISVEKIESGDYYGFSLAANKPEDKWVLLEDYTVGHNCGAFNNLKASYMATRPCVEDGGVITGQIVLFGTGGDMEGGTIDFESMFYNPEAYDLLPIDNEFDDGGEGTTCGFFFPSFWNKVGYMDKDGNSLWERAKADEEAKREQIKRESKDAGVLDKFTTEYPWKPKEAFLQTSNNFFPTAMLLEHRNDLIRTGLSKNIAVHGVLKETKEGIKFRPSDKVRPITKFPTQKGDDIEGCVTLYQAPFKDGSGQVPRDLYVIVHDPYAHEGGSSLGAAYVMKRINPYSKPDDMIVASYVGRPESQDDYNETLFMLAEYYNAQIGFENDRGEVIPYAKRYRKLHWLLEEGEIFDKRDNVSIKKLGRKYGFSMGSGARKGQAILYLRDWLRTKRGKDDEGNRLYNLNTIYDIALLDELIKFNMDGNFDRVSALLVGMFHLKDLYNKDIQAIEESNDDSFFNREFFA